MVPRFFFTIGNFLCVFLVIYLFKINFSAYYNLLINFMQNKKSYQGTSLPSKPDANPKEQPKASNSNQKKSNMNSKDSSKHPKSSQTGNKNEDLKKHKKWKQSFILNTNISFVIKKAS